MPWWPQNQNNSERDCFSCQSFINQFNFSVLDMTSSINWFKLQAEHDHFHATTNIQFDWQPNYNVAVAQTKLNDTWQHGAWLFFFVLNDKLVKWNFSFLNSISFWSLRVIKTCQLIMFFWLLAFFTSLSLWSKKVQLAAKKHTRLVISH